ncbi:MAG: malto-oligosyltrehalose synthase [Nocardioidaceae bacterium]
MTATYRLQLHAGFTFADAAARVPYVAALGVTHLYLSPILQATPGSLHGYDVVDHGRVSDDLGGERALLALAEQARQHGLGLVVDVVPNHMALVAPEHLNAPLWDVLTFGRAAEHAHWFDVDWDHLDGRFGLPVLGQSLRACLDAGEITLAEHAGRPALRYYDHLFPVAPGTDGTDPERVLAAQHYLLAGWQEKADVLNYRRFFDVDTLVAVRVEEADVFEATHRVLLDLNRQGVVEGFRIDHPDGLADPERYLQRLRDQTLPGTAIWVEKILEGEERLPASWACEGTTGYDGLKAVTAALADPSTAQTLTDAWVTAGGEPDLEAVERQAKREVVAGLLTPEHRRLLRRAREALPGDDPVRLGEAITELLVAGEVYRAYVRPGQPASPLAHERIARACAVATRHRPDLEAEIGRLAELMTGEVDGAAAADFAVRFQQTWGPVMAKGIEDTTYYRWHRLVALNEVGGDPGLLEDAAPELLHDWARHQQRHRPLGMVGLSTHDTKRSEDVRARILAVAADAETWTACTEAFAEAADAEGVDRPTAHLLWQTLVGVGDIEPTRLHDYLDKAMREAKLRTSWTQHDGDYEARVHKLATQALSPGPLHALVATAVDHNRDAVRAAVLGQKLLQLTLPGAPDVYQGNETVDLSLVDPDNRRPVDYDAHAARLAALHDGPARDLADEKLRVTTRALAVRRAHRACFGDHGDYVPLDVRSRHVVGFLRGGQVAVLVTRAPQRLEAMGGWAEHVVPLPEGYWHDELTGATHYGGALRCADVFAAMPVALLRRVGVGVES